MSSASRIARTTPVALLMVLFGIVICMGAVQIMHDWMRIGVVYSAIGVLWIVAGPAMVAGGLWALASLGRKSAPLWIGGSAAALAGASVVGGVLTYVIPCSGPG